MPTDSATPVHPAPAHPTNAQLLKATVVSLAIAAVALVLFVLPAEYGIDPTGIGSRLGLTQMTKTQTNPGTPAAVAPAPESAKAERDPVMKRSAPFRSDTRSVVLPPGKGSEIKAKMQAGDVLSFSWSADGGPVNVDMHGEPPNTGNSFTSYWKDSNQTSAHGSFTAPFAGTHGWWWANKGTMPVTVTVVTSGWYDDIALQ